MDIAFIIGGGNLYGSNRCLLLLLDRLEAERIEAGFISTRRGNLEDQLEDRGHPVAVIPKESGSYSTTNLPTRAISLLRFVRKTRNRLRRWDPRFVYVNGGQTAGLLSAGLTGLPVVHHAHSLPSHGLIHPVRSSIWTHTPDLTVAVSHFVRETLLDQGGDPETVHVVPNGYNPPDFQDLDKLRHQSRSSLGIGDDTVCVGVASRLVPEKGIDMIIQAFSQALTTTDQNICLLIAGGETDSPYGRDLQGAAQALTDEGQIQFLGFVTEMPKFYAALDLLVNAPRYPEPFGLTNIEAMAHRVPVIAPATGGIPEIVLDGETGHLVDSLTATQLNQAILELVADHKKREKFGRAGRRRVEERFNVQRFTQGVYEVISPLLR